MFRWLSKSASATAAGAAVALAFVRMSSVEGCSCIEPAPTLCEILELESSLVLHGRILSLTVPDDIDSAGNADVTYEVETIQLYNPDPTVRYSSILEFLTGGNSALCGVEFTIGEEWLIDLRLTADGQWVTGLCFFNRAWDSVTAEELATLETGADCGGSQVFEEVGCYVDDTSARVLTGESLLEDPAMDANACAAFCTNSDYFGTEYGHECFCSMPSDNITLLTEAPNQCNFSCTATPVGEVELCGGENAISIYRNLSPLFGPTYAGCYTDDVDTRVLSGEFVMRDPTMTPEACGLLCAGAPYYGTEYGEECFCGVEGDDPFLLGESTNCDFRCTGDNRQTCGGALAISIYSP